MEESIEYLNEYYIGDDPIVDAYGWEYQGDAWACRITLKSGKKLIVWGNKIDGPLADSDDVDKIISEGFKYV